MRCYFLYEPIKKLLKNGQVNQWENQKFYMLKNCTKHGKRLHSSNIKLAIEIAYLYFLIWSPYSNNFESNFWVYVKQI